MKSATTGRLAPPTFDKQVGHEIFSEAERQAWRELFLRHLGPGEGRRALDLASGTGVISHLLARARLPGDRPRLVGGHAGPRPREGGTRGARDIRFVMGDAERTLEKPESYDVHRHAPSGLDAGRPEGRVQEWHSLLKPGGKVLIVDGDFVSDTLVKRMIRVHRAADAASLPASHTPDAMRETHERILRQVHFSKGARAGEVADLLREAGFAEVTVDRDLKRIHREQAKHMPLLKGLERATQHRYAIAATKR